MLVSASDPFVIFFGLFCIQPCDYFFYIIIIIIKLIGNQVQPKRMDFDGNGKFYPNKAKSNQKEKKSLAHSFQLLIFGWNLIGHLSLLSFSKIEYTISNVLFLL